MIKASAWTIVYCPPTDRFLIAQRSKQSSKPFLWNFFGGGIEEDENPLDGAKRELHEESGCPVNSFKLFTHKDKHIFKVDNYSNAGKNYHYYSIYVKKEFKPKLNKEHYTYRWVKKDNIPNKLHPPTLIGIEKLSVLRKVRNFGNMVIYNE